jgi:branched-chain amino acid transport system ATP-binding protein
LLEVTSLNVFYEEFHVLQDVSMHVEQDEAVGLIGANGHGKSTLMKAICGLIPIQSGEVIFVGERLNDLTVSEIVDLGLVYVAEDRRLFPDMTVRENLELGAYPTHARKRKNENLDLVFEIYPQLKERGNQMARTLSGGEAQMLALARGLMSAAKFMAIDEPSLGLAPNLVQIMLRAIQRINKEGITILLVEENIAQLEAFIDRVYFLEEGKTSYEGPLQALEHLGTKDRA